MAYLEVTGLTIPKNNNKTKNYTSLGFMKGREWLPQEGNELQQITDNKINSLIKDFSGVLFVGNAFKVEEATPNTNDFLIKGGVLHTPLGTLYPSTDIRYTETITDTYMETDVGQVGGDTFIRQFTFDNLNFTTDRLLSTPSSTRNDLVVLVITKREITYTKDATIRNSVLGKETAIREKLFYTFRVLTNVSLADLPNFVNRFTYTNDEYCYRIPIARILRQGTNDSITNSMIVDLRNDVRFGTVVTKSVYKQIEDRILEVQGTGKGFNSDRVDGYHVDNTIDSALWTGDHILDQIQSFAKGIFPQPSVMGFYDPEDPALDSPQIGDRFISTATVDIPGRGSFIINEVYERGTVGGTPGWVAQDSETGWILEDVSQSKNFIKNVDGSWFDFGGVSSHDTLSNLRFADPTSVEADKHNHLSNIQWKNINDIVTQTADDLTDLGIDTQAHLISNATDVGSVHGIKSGHHADNSGFNADRLDGLHLTENTELPNGSIPSTDAIKTYAANSFLPLTGGVVGSLGVNSNTRTAGRFYSGTVDPISSTRINYDGHIHAKNVYADNITDGTIVGEVRAVLNKDLPSGWLRCDGSTVLTSDYPTLGTVLRSLRFMNDSSLGAFARGDNIGDPIIFEITYGTGTAHVHNFSPGDSVTINSMATVGTNVSINTIYYVSVRNSTSFYLHDTLNGALAPTLASSGVRVYTATPSNSIISISRSVFGYNSTHFRLPDLRATHLRGSSSYRALGLVQKDPSALGATLIDQMQKLTGNIKWRNDAANGVVASSGILTGVFKNGPSGTVVSGSGIAGKEVAFDSSGSPGARISSTTTGETRPTSVSVDYIIKY